MMITAHGGALKTGRNTHLYLDNIDLYKCDAIEVDIYKQGNLLYISHLPAFFSYKSKITLEEVFKIVKERNILVNCDLKMKNIITDVIKLAEKMHVEENIIFTGTVKESNNKEITLGKVWFNKLKGLKYIPENVSAIKKRIESLNNEHCVGINVNYKKVSYEFIKECSKQGVSVSLFTVDSVPALLKYVPIVNGNITTNMPNTARLIKE